jgi:hypothetical protein
MVSLNQISPEKRIIFLKKFTSEIILSIVKEIQIKQNIEKEKIKQKILSPIQESKKIFQTDIFQPSKFMEQPKPEYKKFLEIESHQKIKPLENRPSQRIRDLRELRKPIFHRAKTPELIPIQIKKKSESLMQKPLQSSQFQPSQFQPSKQIIQEITPQIKALKEIKPEAKPRPEGFALGKIDSLLKNREIQSIECPGPEKNLLIKRYNKINTTRITLNQEEITDILYSFAMQAKIPVVGGILKAAVGDLVVSAVISEFVGSRFIIIKINPYNLIETG